MQTGILASKDTQAAWQRLVGENNAYTWVQDTQTAKNFDVFIDLTFDYNTQNIQAYVGNTHTLFLLSAVNATPESAFLKHSLKHQGEKIFGINAIPSFLERSTLEISNPFNLDTALVQQLSFWEKMEWVKSRVGMVTPRIVFMIINEAYYTWQEGTAEKSDIDIAMKLGTNYPKGPFEWCNAAGIHHVYNTLLAVYNDTLEERYKICPALKSEWIHAQI